MGGNPSAVGDLQGAVSAHSADLALFGANYHPRNPRATALYAVIEDHLEEFIRIYDEKYQKEFGFWRPVVQEVMEKYLECGDRHHGFARVRCGDCAHEFLLAFSCKGRYFCPSCHQKRVVSFAEWAEQEVLEKVPHRQHVFTIPKMLRIYFKYDRKLLGKLSQCAYETVKEFFQEVIPDKEAVPGVIVSIHTYGEELNFHPHRHAISTDGCFGREGAFHPIPEVDTQKMMELFRHRVFKMLLAEDKITETHIQKLLAWKHTGFSVYRGEKVVPEDKPGREHLASYILHPPMSQEKMSYDPATETVQYRTKKKKGPDLILDKDLIQTFSALDWLARLSAHIPNKWEQMVHYYGWYSNRLRGERKKTQKKSVPVPNSEPASDAEFKKETGSPTASVARRHWARLIKKVYEIDPLVCPRCSGPLRIISFIEDPAIIQKILTHLGLWHTPSRQRAPPPTASQITFDDSVADEPASYD